MARLFKAWLDLYRRWRLVEETPPAPTAKRGMSDAEKLRRAGASIVIERMTDLTKTVQAFA